MFVYVDDKAATINVAFNAKAPVENPEVVIQGFKNGAKVLVNGAVAIDVADAEKFDSIRRPFIYQKDDKLNVTFQATSPVEAPEVVIDSIADDKVSITANGNTIRVTYTNEGATILDNCMGSGTVGVACKNLHRNFIGIELDEEYFKIAEKRIRNANPFNI